jgi:nitrogenase molybdenum-iron protein alpha/beta subunit
MSHKPTFSSSPGPLKADDWLKKVEKMLNIARCTDREKVIYASGRLIDPVADWLDSYYVAHAAADTITWA